jgi:hypothetical protein
MVLFNLLSFPSAVAYFEELEWDEFSLLDDRLFAEMPLGSGYSRAQASAMATSASDQQQTILIYDDGRYQFLLMAAEMLTTSGGDIEDDLKLMFGSPDGTYEGMTAKIEDASGDTPEMAVMTPNQYIPDETGTMALKGSLIKARDGSLISVSIYTSAECFMADQNLCIETSDKILDSIRYGERDINYDSTHAETISTYNITLNKEFTSISVPGVDFEVSYIYEILNSEEVAAGSSRSVMGIYVGASPVSEAPADAKKVAGKILGVNVEWASYETTEGVLMLETVLELPKKDNTTTVQTPNAPASAQGSLSMHIFMSAESQAAMDTLKKMAETLKDD